MSRKSLIETIVLVIIIFILSALPIILSYFLKLGNPQEYGLLRGNTYDLEFTFKELLFFTTNAFCLFIISFSLKYINNKYLKQLLIFISLLYLAMSFIFVLTDILHYIIFAYQLTFSAIQAIITSDIEEGKDFLMVYFSKGIIVAILLSLTFLVTLIWQRKWFLLLLKTKEFFITSLLISLFGIIDLEILNMTDVGRLTKVRYWDITLGEYGQYQAFIEKIKAEKNTLNLAKDYDEFYNADTLSKTIVLVVSESLSRTHMSLYGYERKTTPLLDSRNDIIKLNDCVTSGALTSDAVPSLFYNDGAKDLNLISLLNKLGYETSWISNQAGWGSRDGAIILLSQLCKNTIFIDALAVDDQANASLHYDQEVIKDFDKTLNNNSKKSKFIILHLMGCHFDYEKRYPQDRNYFSGKPPSKTVVNTEMAFNIINAYDNAVRYHDSVVNCLLNIFHKYSEEGNQNAALIFLSDHGEELYERRNFIGHGYPPSKQSSDVPYFVSFSQNFKSNYNNIEDVLKGHISTPYSTRDNFYSIVHLLNIRSEKFNDQIKTNSIFSDHYDSTAIRYVNGVNYKEML